MVRRARPRLGPRRLSKAPSELSPSPPPVAIRAPIPLINVVWNIGPTTKCRAHHVQKRAHLPSPRGAGGSACAAHDTGALAAQGANYLSGQTSCRAGGSRMAPRARLTDSHNLPAARRRRRSGRLLACVVVLLSLCYFASDVLRMFTLSKPYFTICF